MKDPRRQTLEERFHAARRHPEQVVLEGFHAVKHALRFQAEIEELVCSDLPGVLALAERLAPELEPIFRQRARGVPPERLARLAPQAPPTGVLALARRPGADLALLLANPKPAPVILLERPNHLGNLGATIRTAAAAGAAGVLTLGGADPWRPAAVRASAGLHFAVAVQAVQGLPRTDRPLIALHPEGDRLRPGGLPSRALLAFGTERDGLSEGLLEGADQRLRLPMEKGVSSLNLGASVAAVLYSWRLAGNPPEEEMAAAQEEQGRDDGQGQTRHQPEGPQP